MSLRPNPTNVSARPLIRIALLVAFTAIIDAVQSAVTGEKVTFLYKEVMHLSVNDVATFNLILGLPGYIRPLLGAGIDVYPLFGLHRRSYFVLSAIVASVGYLGMATLHRFPYITVLSLMMIAVAGSTLLWIVINAVMVTVGNRTGSFGRLQSVAMFLPLVLNIAYLSHFGGYVTEHWSYSSAFTWAGLLFLLFIPCVFLMEDTPAQFRRRIRTPEQELERQQDRDRRAAILSKALRSPGMWAVVAFVFYLQITPYINTAKTYYQADVLHFSKQYIGDLGVASSVGLLLSIVLFNLISRRLSGRAHVLGAWLGSAAIYISYLGMRDKSSAVLSIACAGFFINYAYLCIFALGARICPPGGEGAIYSLILTAVGSSYLFSEKFGSFLYDYFGPSNKGHNYTIAHGWYSAIWFGLGFTLLGFIFIPLLPRWARGGTPLSKVQIEDQ